MNFNDLKQSGTGLSSRRFKAISTNAVPPKALAEPMWCELLGKLDGQRFTVFALAAEGVSPRMLPRFVRNGSRTLLAVTRLERQLTLPLRTKSLQRGSRRSVPLADILVGSACAPTDRRLIPIADLEPHVIGNAESAAEHVRYMEHCVNDQISIFSAISIASSTSMPR